jgi:SpoVK/Ycf46/Vps4 family AAA+-type ATPase
MLRYGPPGCGKTLLAKSVAGECGVSFLPVSIPELLKGEVGESEKSIAKLFQKAKDMAPCIIFMDEIESIFSNRESGSLSTKVTDN